MRKLLLTIPMLAMPAVPATAFVSEEAAEAAPFFEEFVAVYEVRRGKYEVAEARMALRRTQDGIYRFTSRSEAVGMLAWFLDDVVTEESIFRFTEDGFRAVSYEYRHKGSDKNRDESITYDWTSMVAELEYRGKTNTVELTPGTVDRFLLQLAAARELKEGLDEQSHRVLDNGRVKVFELQASEPETVKVPAGRYETLVISKIDAEDDQRITFWFAPELGFAPVRIEQQKKNEERIRMNLKRIRNPGSGDGD